MAGVIATGCTCTFAGLTILATRVGVETPVAEIVNMTSISDDNKKLMLVATGDWAGGKLTVEYLRQRQDTDPQSLVGNFGTLQFSSGNYSISRSALLESASTEVTVGELIRGTMRFIVTDYSPS